MSKKMPPTEASMLLDIMLMQLRLGINMSKVANHIGVDLVPPTLEHDIGIEERAARVREVDFVRRNLALLGVDAPDALLQAHADYVKGDLDWNAFIEDSSYV